MILKLKHPVSENFWMNISDPGIAIPGVIEYSNLNPTAPASEGVVRTVLYAKDSSQVGHEQLSAN